MVLAENNWHPDENTARDGNCGLDAFARSLLLQMSRNPKARGPMACIKQRSLLRTADDKIALLRQVGVKWLDTNARELMWQGMTIARLCSVVSGSLFPDYLARMRMDGEWIDTAFLHALGAAHGVNVLIFQIGQDPAIVGMDVKDDTSEDGHSTMMVPIALVNDCHFWGVTDSIDAPICAVDKGELPVFASGSGLCPGPIADGRPETSDDDDANFEPTFPASKPNPELLNAELELCKVLGAWCPWDSPGTHLLQAIAHVQRLRDASTDRVDMNAMCMRRAEAITELAYEQEHLKCLPPTLQYQKLARLRLGDCTRWHRRDHPPNFVNMCGCAECLLLDRHA